MYRGGAHRCVRACLLQWCFTLQRWRQAATNYDLITYTKTHMHARMHLYSCFTCAMAYWYTKTWGDVTCCRLVTVSPLGLLPLQDITLWNLQRGWIALHVGRVLKRYHILCLRLQQKQQREHQQQQRRQQQQHFKTIAVVETAGSYR